MESAGTVQKRLDVIALLAMLTEGTFDTGELHVHYGQWTNGVANAAPLILLQ